MNSLFGYTFPAALAANERKDFSLSIDADSDFIIEKVYSNETGPFRLQVIDTTSSYQWFSERIRMENFFGTAQYPNILPTPIELRRSTQLQFDIEDLSGAPNQIELVFEGYRVEENITLGKKKYFCYVKNFTVAALDRTQDTLTTNSDTDFLINRFIAWTDQDYMTKLKMSLSTLSGRQLYSQFTTLENVFGSVLRPNNLTHPLKLEKNAVVKYEVQNTDVNAHSLQLVFDGVKIWS